MEEKYKAKGYWYFYLGVDGLYHTKKEKDDILKLLDGEDLFGYFEKNIYFLMSGKEFFCHVDSGCIIDYDGSLADVFIDGYISNLGLHHKGLQQGKFLVDGKTWLSICKNHKVEVNWANK